MQGIISVSRAFLRLDFILVILLFLYLVGLPWEEAPLHFDEVWTVAHAHEIYSKLVQFEIPPMGAMNSYTASTLHMFLLASQKAILGLLQALGLARNGEGTSSSWLFFRYVLSAISVISGFVLIYRQTSAPFLSKSRVGFFLAAFVWFINPWFVYASRLYIEMTAWFLWVGVLLYLCLQKLLVLKNLSSEGTRKDKRIGLWFCVFFLNFLGVYSHILFLIWPLILWFLYFWPNRNTDRYTDKMAALTLLAPILPALVRMGFGSHKLLPFFLALVVFLSVMISLLPGSASQGVRRIIKEWVAATRHMLARAVVIRFAAVFVFVALFFSPWGLLQYVGGTSDEWNAWAGTGVCLLGVLVLGEFFLRYRKNCESVGLFFYVWVANLALAPKPAPRFFALSFLALFLELTESRSELYSWCVGWMGRRITWIAAALLLGSYATSLHAVMKPRGEWYGVYEGVYHFAFLKDSGRDFLFTPRFARELTRLGVTDGSKLAVLDGRTRVGASLYFAHCPISKSGCLEPSKPNWVLAWRSVASDDSILSRCPKPQIKREFRDAILIRCL